MKRNQGFHLIEILIVLGIISILSTIALPLYSHYLTQLKRLNAAHMLLKLSLALEEYHTNYQTYEHASFTALHISEWLDNYHLVITTETGERYQLLAKPSVQQAKKDSACGGLILDSDGAKNITGTGKIDDCW